MKGFLLLFLFFADIQSKNENWGRSIEMKEDNNMHMIDFFPLIDGTVLSLFLTHWPRMNFHLVKFDASGRTLWGKEIHIESLRSSACSVSVSVDESINIIYLQPSDQDISDFTLLKFSSEGNLMFTLHSSMIPVSCVLDRIYNRIFNLEEIPVVNYINENDGSTIISFNLFKKVIHEWKDSTDNTQFLEHVLLFQEDRQIGTYGVGQVRIDKQTEHSYTSKEKQTEDYLSEDEFNQLTDLEKLEYHYRNIIFKSWTQNVHVGFFLCKISSSGDILWKKSYLFNDDVVEMVLVKSFLSTTSGSANLLGYIFDNKNKETSYFHMKLNTFDGSIEKKHIFLTNKLKEGVPTQPWKPEDIFHVVEKNKGVFYITQSRVKNLRYLMRGTSSQGDGQYLFRINFEEKKISCKKGSAWKRDVMDIFWDKNVDKLALVENVHFEGKTYYFDDESENFKPQFRSYIDVSNLLDVERGTRTGKTVSKRIESKKINVYKTGFISQQTFGKTIFVLATTDEFGASEKCGLHSVDIRDVKDEITWGDQSFNGDNLILEDIVCEDDWKIDENNEVLSQLEVADTNIISFERNKPNLFTVHNGISETLKITDYCENDYHHMSLCFLFYFFFVLL